MYGHYKEEKKSKQDQFLNHVFLPVVINIIFADQFRTILSSSNYTDSSIYSIFPESKHDEFLPGCPLN